jgi:DNA-binding transcriptional ArsR family regulator
VVRNWDTIRAILLKLEAAEMAHTTVTLDQVDGIAPQEVGYHMMLLRERGLIEANILKSSTGDGGIATALARRLTFDGHDFLDQIRDPSLWGKIKSKVKEKGLDLTFDTIKAAAAALVKSALL